jgi:hypothetical protein
MKFITVYNVLQDYFKLSIFIPIIMLIGGIVFFRHIRKDAMGIEHIIKYIITPIYIAIMSFVLIGFIFQYSIDYFQIVKPYLEKKYLIVEGNIKDFIPMPEGGHVNESFNVNNIHFEYSSYSSTAGFKKVALSGGPLKQNGQYVRIGYIARKGIAVDNENIIVKIELLTK